LNSNDIDPAQHTTLEKIEPTEARLRDGSRDLSEPLSDLWIARRIAQHFGRNIHFVESIDKWFVFDEKSGRWSLDETREVIRIAAQVVTTVVRTEIDAAAKDQVAEGLRRRTQSARGLGSAIELLRAELGIATSNEIWNRNAHLAGALNGTIDLRTGELRKPRREDYITKHCGVAFDPHAECPTFISFLERVLPEQDTRDYLQRALGYALIGNCVEHVLHIFYGTGANGKTTLLEAVRHAFGTYAVTAPPTLLMKQKSDRHPTEVASLFGARLVIASETEDGGRLDQSTMKRLTGGDGLSTRRMNEDFWDFDPTHTLFLITNHKPRITGGTDSVWRRLRLIPFGVSIPSEGQDPQLPEKLRAEAAGILAWIVRGALAYRDRGLVPPDAVRVATREYQDNEDALGQFLTEQLMPMPGAHTAIGAIYERYELWFEESGLPKHERLSKNALSTKLKERGFIQERSKYSRGFKDVALRANENSDPSDGDPSGDAGDAR
jgi:putative DNA primase/helicase